MTSHDEVAHVLAEVARELPAGHRLYGQPITPIARESGGDRVLVRVHHADPGLVVVWLTWRDPSNASRPRWRAYTSIRDFYDGEDR
jgi:hypothetical protein